MAAQTVENKRLLVRGQKFDSEAGIFEGYASIFGNLDSDGDIVEPGAYSKFLAEDWSRVKILALHNDRWLPIGKPIELYEDDIGLYIKAKISDTSMGLDIRQLLKDGVLDELSIGYIVLDSFRDSDGNRHLTELELMEVSIVTWAANEQAKILSVKSTSDKTRNFYELLLAAHELEQVSATLRRLANIMVPSGGTTENDKPKSSKGSQTLPARLSGLSHKSKPAMRSAKTNN